MSTVFYILIGVFGFALMIFLHELGHFLSAKLSGVRVNEFAIGMGPKILKFQKGETLYSVRLLPIGGFCSMEGEDGESDDPKAFHRAKVWKRIIILVMGAVMNLLFGFILMMVIQGQEPAFTSTTVSGFAEHSVSAQSGLEVGDRLLKVDGYSILVTRDVDFAFGLAYQEQRTLIDVVVNRNGETVTLENFRIPIRSGMIDPDFWVAPIEKNVFTLIGQSFKETVSMVKLVWVSLHGMITGRFGLNEMAGPVGAVDMVSQVTSAGMQRSFLEGMNMLIQMLAMISINLGVMNLLPLPALDGGRLVFQVIELIFRKPFPRKYEGYVHGAGFALLMLLTIVLTFNDIVRIVTGG